MNTVQIPTSYYGYNHLLPFSWQEVIRLEGAKNYTVFVFQNGQRHISTKIIFLADGFTHPVARRRWGELKKEIVFLN